jgi:hypothetical protein
MIAPFNVHRRSFDNILFPVQQLIAHQLENWRYKNILSKKIVRGKEDKKDISIITSKTQGKIKNHSPASTPLVAKNLNPISIAEKIEKVLLSNSSQ